MLAPRYPYVAVDVTSEEADEAGALLFELGASGVELRDDTTLSRGAGGKVTLWAGFACEDDVRTAIAALPSAWQPRPEQVVGDAWRDEWKKHFEPFRLCRGVVVRPPWQPAHPAEGDQVIVLEPGRAFGTGLHETTRLVAAILADHASEIAVGPVLDVGCGSGILALAAVILGATGARAIDIDGEAVNVTRENADRNGLAGRIQADETPLAEVLDSYPAVLANIESGPLVQIASDLRARVKPGGMIALSGILADDVAPSQLREVRDAYQDMVVEEVRREGEWVALVLRAGP